MALVYQSLIALRNAIAHLKKNSKTSLTCLSFSWQDILASEKDLNEIFGETFFNIPSHIKSREILNWHKAKHHVERILDFDLWLKKLGIENTCLDLGKFRGSESFHDSNKPLPEEYHRKYDLVLDNVSTHCGDILQSIENAFLACKKGGLIYHIAPLFMSNQGYYSPAPTLFRDLYEANQSRIIYHRSFVFERLGSGSFTDDNLYARIANPRDRTIQLVLAEKGDYHGELKLPIQKKFIDSPACLIEEKKHETVRPTEQA